MMEENKSIVNRLMISGNWWVSVPCGYYSHYVMIIDELVSLVKWRGYTLTFLLDLIGVH